jgi:hypothetical protein
MAVHSDRPFVLLGSPDCPRVNGFRRALADLGLPPATLAPWSEFLTERIRLPEVVKAGAVVRIESPGKAFEAGRLLLARGASVPDEEGDYARLSCREALALEPERGRLLTPRQWYLGFRDALEEVERQLADCPPHTRMNHPADIALMFDKPGCQALLDAAGVPVPRALGLIGSYDDLVARMREAGCRRVFVKLAHGSSASGVVAYRTNGAQHQAITTVEMARHDGALRLYNSRRIRDYRDPQEIAELIDALCRHRACAEEWIPKASLDGHAFDLRVVVIGDRACHTVARLSRSPLTNLHLLNQRRPRDFIDAHLGAEGVEAGLRTCERAMSCFPHSLYAGVDLLFATGLRRHAVVELNAFGDLLPGTLHHGHDTYTAEIVQALHDSC